MNLSPSAPVFDEQFRRELLPVVIAHDKASVQFLDDGKTGFSKKSPGV